MAEFPSTMGLSLAGRNEHGAPVFKPYAETKENLIKEITASQK